MSFYTPDVVYYDVVPPLRYAGTAALRDRFLHWFSNYKGGIDLETRDLHVVVSSDLAFAFWFSRAAGTMPDGRPAGSWVRATNCWRRIDGTWLVVHEHISWPVDGMSGMGVRDLVP